MADTVNSIASLVRFIADDQEIQFLDTAVQVAPINAGYREFQRRMVLCGSSLMRQTVVLTVPANTTQIDPMSETVQTDIAGWPDNFVAPYMLWERPVSSPAILYRLMEECDWPLGVPPKPFLNKWAWQGGTLNFIGATQPLDVQMQYIKYYYPFIAPDQEVPVVFWGAIDAIVWATLYLVAMQRGAPADYRDRCSQNLDRIITDLTSRDVHRDQLQRRHRPAHNKWMF